MKILVKKMRTAFLKEESGAVTVDWVVLTSAIIGLGIAVIATIWQGAETYALKVNSEVGQITVVDY